MGYRCEILCDKCGDGYFWTEYGMNERSAVVIARNKGWQVGKTGWFCPKCRTRKRSSKNGKAELVSYCVRDDCPHSDCRRNRRNIPSGYVISMADLQDLDGDNCRNYLKGDSRGKTE